MSDPLIARYLELRERTGYRSPLLRPERQWWTRVRSHLPLAPNVTAPEFLPTMQMVFFDKLLQHFPRHRLLLSDFDRLPTSCEGVDAPIVQTRQRHTPVPCSTYLVSRGWFDIFFPTNFELMQDIYRLCQQEQQTSPPHHTHTHTHQHQHQHQHTNPPPTVRSQVLTHRAFLERYAGDLKRTTTKSGENPMLEHYQNVKFFLT